MTDAQRRLVEIFARLAAEAILRGEYSEPRTVPEPPPAPPALPERTEAA